MPYVGEESGRIQGEGFWKMFRGGSRYEPAYFKKGSGNREEKGYVQLMDLDRMSLIDVHSHADGISSGLEATPEIILDLMQEESLTYGLLMGRDHEALIRKVKPHSARAGALLWVVPNEQNHYPGLEKMIEENLDVVKGFKFHPTSYNHPISDKTMGYFFVLADRYDLIIVTHTDIHSRSGSVEPLLRHFPQTRLILYHAAPLDEACRVMKNYPNVCIDTSYTAFDREVIQTAIREAGKERVLFGIDAPLGFEIRDGQFLPHYRDAAREVAAFVDHDEDLVEHIMYRNARRFLKLDS